MSDYVKYWELKWDELDIYEAYGPNFASPVFDPLTRNIRTKQLMARTHHCKHGCGGKPRSRRCFLIQHLHFGFCLAPVRDENGNEVICGEVFQVASTGCATHPYINGFNLVFRELAKGAEMSAEAKGIRVKTPEEMEAERKEQENRQNELASRDWKAWEVERITKQREVAEAKKVEQAEQRQTARASRRTGKLPPAPGLKSVFGGKKTKKP
jgi:hypothetical protein